MNKKGITPIIATVILVAFALLIGAITMNLGKDYVDTDNPQSEQVNETPTIPLESTVVVSINDVFGDDLKILQMKYISGKITKQEYIEMEKKIINS